ncbi:NAD(P)H-hydrate dehydratase [Nocardioides antri]|uniref:ADP-dependent (S)-NAD(P)H-hydrate dehydratase n=1 Tax=Nocardioides antri TaxID=2607659 RepID=A0A5B1M441_9ACTN|nr:NAD(P)H-hydrate dehydratase [Nocardioides antri]KAA1427534.1 NAD(P)H-hydrate dehydratase [Nocardioides antri]
MPDSPVSPGDVRVVTPTLLRDWPLPEPGEDKQSSGRLLVLGGSTRSPGAVRLAGEAAFRVGAGKVTLATVETATAGLAPLLPEAALLPLTTAGGSIDVEQAASIVDEVSGVDVLLAGSGLVDAEHAVSLLERVLPHTDAALVLDALGSAYLAEHPEGLWHLDGPAVLTANPRELAHVAGASEDDVTRDPVGVATRVAEQCHVVVLCGGTVKHLVTPEGEAWVVEGGGPGLAASGSGDVQAGIVAGLLARGATPAQAAAWAGYIHARCGERLAATIGPVGYLARELPAQVPAVLAELA